MTQPIKVYVMEPRLVAEYPSIKAAVEALHLSKEAAYMALYRGNMVKGEEGIRYLLEKVAKQN